MDTDYIGKHRDDSEEGRLAGSESDTVSRKPIPNCVCGCNYVGTHRAEVTA